MKKVIVSLSLISSMLFADNSIGLDTVVGGVLGVAVGNQIGKGTGRDVARVVGGLAGAGIANGMREEQPRYIQTNSYSYPSNNSYTTTTRTYSEPVYQETRYYSKPTSYERHNDYQDGYQDGYSDGYRKGVRDMRNR